VIFSERGTAIFEWVLLTVVASEVFGDQLKIAVDEFRKAFPNKSLFADGITISFEKV
jgi:hypothetical protein